MTEAPPDAPPDTGEGVDEQRLANLRRLEETGYPPFAAGFPAACPLGEARSGFQEGRSICLAGRLVTLRDMGKSVFADLQDATGRIQIYLGRNQMSTEAFKAFHLLDVGDLIGVTGEMFVTRSGEPTVKVAEWRLLSKSLRPLPEKWHGLRDVEIRYRQRHLDLIANAQTRTIFEARCGIVRAVREFLWSRGFSEVETPMMQAQPGGANARPFRTHYTALNADMYLRIAPELFLKRLLVGGLTRVFELNRNFRNEGLSRNHNPEFTMLEVYQAWADRRAMQDLVREMILTVARQVCGGERVGQADAVFDLGGPWREAAYRELILEKMGPEWYDLPVARARQEAAARGLTPAADWDHAQITHEVYEKLIERTLVQPTFVTRLPASLVPLARRCEDDPSVVDVFELVIAGMEIAPGYSELNDPLEQRRRFADQTGDEAQRTDEEFLEAMECGMPPAGGMGVGIDRLVMVLTGAQSIRDVILFPQLRSVKDMGSGL